jgi:hypothetical protein
MKMASDRTDALLLLASPKIVKALVEIIVVVFDNHNGSLGAAAGTEVRELVVTYTVIHSRSETVFHV